MQNLPLDTETKVIIVIAFFITLGIVCFIGNWFAKLITKHLEDLPEYTKEDHKIEKRINKFKSKI